MKWIPDGDASPTDATAPLNAILAHRLMLNTRAADGDAGPLWSVLLDLRDQSLNGLNEDLEPDFPGELIIPSVYSAEERARSEGRRLVVVFARQRLVEHLNSNARRYRIFAIADGIIHDDDMIDVSAEFHPPEPVPVSADTVVMAIIDDGIAIANDLFRAGRTTTRVEHHWTMSASPRSAGRASEGPAVSRRSTIGRTVECEDINALLKACTASDLLDETGFYERTGQIDFGNGQFSPVSLQRSHGTHIAALAAGHPMAKAVSNRPIISVSLPARVTQDVTGQSSLPALALALQALHHQARRFVVTDKAGKSEGILAPVVLNFSFGDFSGPHDGTGEVDFLFEQFLGKTADQIATDAAMPQSRELILPAGNGNLSRTHAEIKFPKGKRKKPRTLNLVARPDDRTATHVEMWTPRANPPDSPPDYVTVEVTPPGGPVSKVLVGGGSKPQSFVLLDADHRMLARLTYVLTPGPTARGLITLSLNPTDSLTERVSSVVSDRASCAPAGVWKIKVRAVALKSLDTPCIDQLPGNSIQVWVRRDETLPGFLPGGRQARFSDPDYELTGKFGKPLTNDPDDTKSLVRREGTLSGFAAGTVPTVVGAATIKPLSVSDYSATGPLSPPPNPGNGDSEPLFRIGPDVVARGDDSLVLRGVISAGSTSGSFVRLNGTSVAAPMYARALACQIEAGLGAPTAEPIGLEGEHIRHGRGYVPVDVKLLDVQADILTPYSGSGDLC